MRENRANRRFETPLPHRGSCGSGMYIRQRDWYFERQGLSFTPKQLQSVRRRVRAGGRRRFWGAVFQLRRVRPAMPVRELRKTHEKQFRWPCN